MEALVLAGFGVLLVLAPQLAVQVFGTFALAAGCAYLALRLYRYFSRYRKEHRLKWRWFLVAAAVLALVLFVLSQVNMLTAPMNLLLSALLLLNARASGRRIGARYSKIALARAVSD